jgi:hypothetical protein
MISLLDVNLGKQKENISLPTTANDNINTRPRHYVLEDL